MKKKIIHGTIAGILSGITSVAYMFSYSSNMQVDFSSIANPVMIILTSTIGLLMATIGYWGINKLNWFGVKTELVFNFIFFILSFVSIFGTFGAPLPDGTIKPELFSGMVIPMHFFPMLFWLMLKPVFKNK